MPRRNRSTGYLWARSTAVRRPPETFPASGRVAVHASQPPIQWAREISTASELTHLLPPKKRNAREAERVEGISAPPLAHAAWCHRGPSPKTGPLAAPAGRMSERREGGGEPPHVPAPSAPSPPFAFVCDRARYSSRPVPRPSGLPPPPLARSARGTP